MNSIKKLMIVSALAIAGAGIQAPALGSENPGYELIDPPLPGQTEGKISVVEMFSYGCPHCFALDPELHQWEQDLASDIEFTREAPALNKFWKFRSQAFYAAHVLGVTEQMHQAYFDAVHLQGRKLKKRKPILEFINEIGLDAEAFELAMNSDEVKALMDAALAQAKAADVSGVPTLIINGKYKTGPKYTGEQQKVVDVIKALIEKERQ